MTRIAVIILFLLEFCICCLRHGNSSPFLATFECFLLAPMAFCIEFEEPCHVEIKRRLVKENVLAVTDSLLELGGVTGFSTHVDWTDGQLWVEVRTELSNCFRLMNNVWLGLFLFSGTWQMSCNMFFSLSYHNHLFRFCKCICNDASENIKLMYRWNMGGGFPPVWNLLPPIRMCQPNFFHFLSTSSV